VSSQLDLTLMQSGGQVPRVEAQPHLTGHARGNCDAVAIGGLGRFRQCRGDGDETPRADGEYLVDRDVGWVVATRQAGETQRQTRVGIRGIGYVEHIRPVLVVHNVDFDGRHLFPVGLVKGLQRVPAVPVPEPQLGLPLSPPDRGLQPEDVALQVCHGHDGLEAIHRDDGHARHSVGERVGTGREFPAGRLRHRREVDANGGQVAHQLLLDETVGRAIPHVLLEVRDAARRPGVGKPGIIAPPHLDLVGEGVPAPRLDV